MTKQQQYTIVGIDTNIGKTIASAILVENLQANYWKPVQTGSLEDMDSNFIQKFTNFGHKILPEIYYFEDAISPHQAAKNVQSNIDISTINLPIINNNLIVETAGGILSPLNDTQQNIHLIQQLNLPTILVSKNYLGSINHTLLTIEFLKQKNITIQGIIFNGEKNQSSQDYILQNSGCKYLGNIDWCEKISKEFIVAQTKNICFE